MATTTTMEQSACVQAVKTHSGRMCPSSAVALVVTKRGFEVRNRYATCCYAVEGTLVKRTDKARLIPNPTHEIVTMYTTTQLCITFAPEETLKRGRELIQSTLKLMNSITMLKRSEMGNKNVLHLLVNSYFEPAFCTSTGINSSVCEDIVSILAYFHFLMLVITPCCMFPPSWDDKHFAMTCSVSHVPLRTTCRNTPTASFRFHLDQRTHTMVRVCARSQIEHRCGSP